MLSQSEFWLLINLVCMRKQPQIVLNIETTIELRYIAKLKSCFDRSSVPSSIELPIAIKYLICLAKSLKSSPQRNQILRDSIMGNIIACREGY